MALAPAFLREDCERKRWQSQITVDEAQRERGYAGCCWRRRGWRRCGCASIIGTTHPRGLPARAGYEVVPEWDEPMRGGGKVYQRNGANHIHSVWRDVANDFANDVLREHLVLYHAMQVRLQRSGADLAKQPLQFVGEGFGP